MFATVILFIATSARFEERLEELCKRCPYACRYHRGESDLVSVHVRGINPGSLPAEFEGRARGGSSAHDMFNLPQFIIIGAQKAGTSDLWARLKRRAGILGPGAPGFEPGESEAGYYLQRDKGGADKELHWFDHCLGVNGGKSKTALMLTKKHPNTTLWCDVNDYVQCWPPQPPVQKPVAAASSAMAMAAGEASPSYLLFPELAAVMHAVVPDAKLVVLLRDPVARAFSSYYNGRSAWQHPKHLGLKDNARFIPFQQAVLPELRILEQCATAVPDIARRFKECIWPEFVVQTLELTLTASGPWNASAEYGAGRCSAYYVRKRSLLIRGLYAGQLQAYFEHYPAPKRLMVLNSADYFQDPDAIADRVAAHVREGGDRGQDETVLALSPDNNDRSAAAAVSTTAEATEPADRNPTTPLHAQMDPTTKTQLEAVFAPYNALLYTMLADRGVQFTPF